MKSINNLSTKLEKGLAIATLIASPLYTTGCTTTITKPITKYIGIEEIEMQFLHPFPERIDYRKIKRKRDFPRPVYYDNKEQESEAQEEKSEFNKYLDINPNKLTEKQKEYLQSFNEFEQEVKKQGKTIFSEEETKEIKKDYSFINPNSLTTRDKVYLMQEFNKAMDAVSAFSF